MTDIVNTQEFYSLMSLNFARVAKEYAMKAFCKQQYCMECLEPGKQKSFTIVDAGWMRGYSMNRYKIG